MPLHFPGVSTQQYGYADGGPATAVPLTLSLWFQVPEVPQYDIEMVTLYKSDNWFNYYGLNLSGPLSGTAGKGGVNAYVRNSEASTGGAKVQVPVTPNTWQHAAAVFYDSTTRAAFLNGGNKATESVALALQPTNQLVIAKRFDIDRWFAGQMAHVAIWNVALTDGEIYSLSRGFSPRLIRPESLGAYWVLEGYYNPEPSRSTAAPAVASNPLAGGRLDINYFTASQFAPPQQYLGSYPRIIESTRQRLSVPTRPTTPYNPYPANGATAVTRVGLTLSWSCDVAQAFNVYFGPASTGGVHVSNQTGTTWTPPLLTPGVTYVWAIQAYNNAGVSNAPGWSFTVQPNLTPPAGALVVSQVSMEVFADQTLLQQEVPGIAEGIWHEFLICGHALKSIDAWYVGGLRQPTASAQAPLSQAYFLIPGYTAWDAAFPTGNRAKTITRNGRTYTVIYALEDLHSPLVMVDIVSGTTPITLNVKGIEDRGDGTGLLLTRSLDIYLHMLQNWVYGDYTSGSWEMTDTFIDGRPVIREASFSAAHEVSLKRIPASGYVGAGAVGSNGDFISARDLIRQLNLSCDVSSGLNRHCQFIVKMTDDDPVTLQEAPTLTDIGDILQGSFDISDDFSNHFNALWYLYKKDYLTGMWTQNKIQDDVALKNYNEELLMESQEYWFVRHKETAADIAARKLLRHKDPPRLVKFALASIGFNIELGDLRKVSHYGGIGATGWSAEPIRIHKHLADVNRRRVDFEGYDMQRIYAQAFVLRDETTRAAMWTEADPAVRQYDGYLADEVTATFSDGDDAKRLR